MIIKYGIIDNNIDVTQICYNKLLHNNIITIPINEHTRTVYFTDPIFGTLKKIFIIQDDNILEYDHMTEIKININTNKITTRKITNEYIDNELSNIHKKCKIKYGSFDDELPEQQMAVIYLTGYEKVLEIGGNIGRNSLVISNILSKKNNTNLVTLESNIIMANKLRENRDLNDMNFHIESSALSKRKLIQRGNVTIESNKLLRGYKNVNTITLDELYSKYNIDFDTLILDCEGAFYYILMDMPEILTNIKLLIMENDYPKRMEKVYVDKILKKYNFYVDYVRGGGWGPCKNCFFEVWKKNPNE